MSQIDAAAFQADLDRFQAFLTDFEELVKKHDFNPEGFFVGVQFQSA